MALVVNDLTCGYGDDPVVERASFALAPGRVLAVLGPNGVGKTTLFKCVLGFLPARGGSVEIDGAPLASLSRAELAQRIAYVPQMQTLPFAYTVEGRGAHGGARPTSGCCSSRGRRTTPPCSGRLHSWA